MIPRHPGFDSTLALKREGYDFITREGDRLGTDAFETRLFLSPVVCAYGPDAAQMFWQPGRFTRVGATPATTVRLLQGRASVNMLDADAHHRRKALFLAILNEAGVASLRDVFVEEWSRQFAEPAG